MEILHEDNHLLILNKAPGEIVQGDITGDMPLVELAKQHLKQVHQKPGNVFLGVTHRIDRPTSGAVVFAKTSKALERMNALFREGKVEKTYWAVTKELPPSEEGVLEHYLLKNQAKNKSFVVQEGRKGSKLARLSYRLEASTDHYHLLSVRLHTGRHHQIRCQLSRAGCPIKGDLKYGFGRSNPDGGIHLHARRVAFLHPVSQERVEVVAAPPRDVLWDEFVKIILK